MSDYVDPYDMAYQAQLAAAHANGSVESGGTNFYNPNFAALVEGVRQQQAAAQREAALQQQAEAAEQTAVQQRIKEEQESQLRAIAASQRQSRINRIIREGRIAVAPGQYMPISDETRMLLTMGKISPELVKMELLGHAIEAAK